MIEIKTFNRNSKKVNLFGLTEVQIYELVRQKVIGRFPLHFFDCEDAKEYCPSITRYLIEDIMKWTDADEVPKKIRKETFAKNKLAGMLNAIYHSSPSEAIMSAYPDRDYRPWQFHEAPNGYWKGKDGKANGIVATKWLFETKLKWTKEDMKRNISWKLFEDNGLGGMLKRCFNCSIWECIETTYPGDFKRWEIADHVPNEYWDIEKGNLATKWLIETKLNWGEDDVKEKLNKQVFIDNDLYGMIQSCFGASPYLAINSAFPNKYKPWDLKQSPYLATTLEYGGIATKWLLEDKLKWGDKEIREKLSGRTFKENGFVILTEKYTVHELINEAYPGRYMPWEIRATTPFGFWGETTVKQSVRWLVEEKLSISIEEAKKLQRYVFKENGMSGVIDWFKGSVPDLIDYVYDVGKEREVTVTVLE